MMEKFRVSSMNPQSVAGAAPGSCGARIIRLLAVNAEGVYGQPDPGPLRARGQKAQLLAAKYTPRGPGGVPRRRSAQEALELLGIQAVPAHDGAVEQQNGDVEPITAAQLGVAVHVHHVDGREGLPAPERLQLGEHLVAETAAVPVHDCQPTGAWHGR